MHQLYLHFLSCKAQWSESRLVLRMRPATRVHVVWYLAPLPKDSNLIRSSNSQENEELYEWWSFSKMQLELGPELAADLVSRHRAADPKVTGKFVKWCLVRRHIARWSAMRTNS